MCAASGTRTRTAITGQGILSPFVAFVKAALAYAEKK